MTRYVYDFTDGSKDLKDLLGGKGANLAEMTLMGLPVPPGFTVTTEACRAYLRIIRFLRTPEYDQLFSGDPTWVTEALVGIGCDGRPLVTRTSFRYPQTLYNLGPSPEPNLTDRPLTWPSPAGTGRPVERDLRP